jgi:hypothetical protein
MKNKFFLIVIAAIFLNSCTNVKNALTGKKTENSDEFLVQKKNPLEMPPSYNELPEPTGSIEKNTNEERINEEINNLLKKIKDPQKKNSQSLEVKSSAEQFILKNIK